MNENELKLEIKSDKCFYFAGELIKFKIKFKNIKNVNDNFDYHNDQQHKSHSRSLSFNFEPKSAPIDSSSNFSSDNFSLSQKVKPLPQRCNLVGSQNLLPSSSTSLQSINNSNSMESLGKGKPSPLKHNRNVHSVDYSSSPPTSPMTPTASTKTNSTKRFTTDNSKFDRISPSSPQQGKLYFIHLHSFKSNSYHSL